MTAIEHLRDPADTRAFADRARGEGRLAVRAGGEEQREHAHDRGDQATARRDLDGAAVANRELADRRVILTENAQNLLRVCTLGKGREPTKVREQRRAAPPDLRHRERGRLAARRP